MKNLDHSMGASGPWRGALHFAGRGIAVAALIACVSAPTWAQSQAQYSVPWSTIDGGGTSNVAGGAYALSGTIGQMDAGRLLGGSYSLGGGFWLGGSAVTGVEGGEDPATAPLAFRLHAAVPNPVFDHALVAFDLPREEPVRIRLYDATGRLTRVLAQGTFKAGRHEQTWDGTDDEGRRIAPGMYFMVLDAGALRSRQKVVVTR